LVNSATVESRVVGQTTASYTASYVGDPQLRSIAVQQAYDGDFSAFTPNDPILHAAMNMNPFRSEVENMLADNANILSNLVTPDNALTSATITFQIEPNANLAFSHFVSFDSAAFDPGTTLGFGLANAAFAPLDYSLGSFTFFLNSSNGELIQQSFQSGAEANTYFTDRWFDLGVMDQSPGASNFFNWGFTIQTHDSLVRRSTNPTLFANSFQTVTGAIAAVPEPSSILSLAFASTALLLKWRARRTS
jgi:hypothetical protein